MTNRKFYIGAGLCIWAFALISTNAGAEEGVCAKVACSGHGQCIETANGPACACHAGYTPDATGLNCVAEAASPTPTAEAPPQAGTTAAAATPQVLPTTGVLPREYGREDYERVKAALPRFSHEEDYATYGRLRRSGRIQGSFIEYKLYRAQKRKAGGIALVAVGSVLSASFFPLLGVGIAEASPDDASCAEWGDSCDFDGEHFMEFFGPGLGCLLTGTPLIISGAIRLKRTKVMREALQSLDASAPSATAQPLSSRFSIAPFYLKHSSTFGLSGSFVF